MKKHLCILALTCLSLVGCAGVSWPTIQTDVVNSLSALQTVAAKAAATGAVPSGKAADAVADTGTITNALGKLATGTAVTTADANAIAASLHADGKTTDYIDIGTQVINGFVALTNAYIAAHQPAATVQAAQTQYLVNATPAVQAGLTQPTATNP